MEEDLSWIPSCFHVIKKCHGYISGIVTTEDELTKLLENHKMASLTSYLKWSDHVNETSKGRQLWQVEDYSEDVPLFVRRRIILMCQQGKAPCKRAKEKCEHVEQEYTKRRFRIQTIKKVDCPAKIFIRHVTRYDTFSVKGDASRTRKEDAMKRLKQELSQTEVPTSMFIHIKLPLVEAHQNHQVYLGLVDNGCSWEGAQTIVDNEFSGEGALSMVDSGGRGEGNMDRRERKKIKVAQLALRKELKKLTDASYLCENLESLKRTTALLKMVSQSIEPQCQRENGLMLNKEKKKGREENVRPLSSHKLKAKR